MEQRHRVVHPSTCFANPHQGLKTTMIPSDTTLSKRRTCRGPEAPAEPPSHGPELATDPPPSPSYLQTQKCQWDGCKLCQGKVLGKSNAIIINSLLFAWDGSHWCLDGGGSTQINKHTSFGQMSGPLWLFTDGPSQWRQAQHRGTRRHWQPWSSASSQQAGWNLGHVENPSL